MSGLPTRSLNGIDWDTITERLSKHPGESILDPQLEGVDNHRGLYNAVRYGKIGALRTLSGVVVPNVRSVMGSRNIYLTWLPDEPRENHYRREVLK